MKKTYIFPEVKVVNIKVQNILITQSTENAQEMSSGSFGARGASFSDDEWDEE